MGNGKVFDTSDSTEPDSYLCSECCGSGSGVREWVPCPVCRGRGEVASADASASRAEIDAERREFERELREDR